tara:strand:+ start:1375 stop:1602 length:228 start_codon:yes stop_codon:yes gene_type:complete
MFLDISYNLTIFPFPQALHFVPTERPDPLSFNFPPNVPVQLPLLQKQQLQVSHLTDNPPPFPHAGQAGIFISFFK